MRGSRKACARPRILAAAFIATPLCVVLGCAGRVVFLRGAAEPGARARARARAAPPPKKPAPDALLSVSIYIYDLECHLF